MLVWRFIPDRPAHSTPADDAHGPSNSGQLLASIKQIPEYLILAAVTFAGIGFPGFIVKIFPIQEFGFSETQVGIPIGIGALVLAAASVPMSKFGERIGRVRAVHVGLALSAVGMWVVGIGMFIPALRHPWVLGIAGLPVGIGFLLTIPAWFASVSDLDKTRRGANIGAVMTAQGLGTIVGPVIGAFVIVTMQNYLASFGVFVLVIFGRTITIDLSFLGEMVPVIQGAIFVVIVLAFRKGLVGEIAEWWKTRGRKAS